jgi:hypothetical protein
MHGAHMSKERIRIPAALYVYIGLVIFSLLYFISVAEESPMGAIYAMLLTIPWSIGLTYFISGLFPDLFEKVWIGPLIIIVSAIINSIILIAISNKGRLKISTE